MPNEKMTRPREIIEFCLKPLELDKASQAYELAYARLEHVIKTYQKEILREKKPIAVDFSQMRTITLNEDAHGND